MNAERWPVFSLHPSAFLLHRPFPPGPVADLNGLHRRQDEDLAVADRPFRTGPGDGDALHPACDGEVHGDNLQGEGGGCPQKGEVEEAENRACFRIHPSSFILPPSPFPGALLVGQAKGGEPRSVAPSARPKRPSVLGDIKRIPHRKKRRLIRTQRDSRSIP